MMFVILLLKLTAKVVEDIGELNNDSQLISVSGVVREKDVTASNSVLSSKLADSHIKFQGEGLIASRTKPGILTRFINWLF